MSKKRRYVLIFALTAALTVFVCAASQAAPAAPDEKVGSIDPQRVLFQHPKYEQTQKQINSIKDKREAEVKAAIDKESDDRKKAELYRQAVREVAEEERKLMQPLFGDIDMAIRTVAGAKKITVVVDKTALFYGGMDITDDVVQELKKKNASGG
jgi:outer membrane protein